MNVLIDDADNARITDFGLSVYINGKSQDYGSTRAGNRQWLSPEMLEAIGRYPRPTQEADVYSFSHVCIEVRMSLTILQDECI